MFQIGQIYSRTDLHRAHGGQPQGGIATPRGFAGVLLFTGEGGQRYGYRDRWDGDVFRYTGEGQRGDMTFVRGNRAIRDHLQDGKDLHLFEIEPEGCRYVGVFACGGWTVERGPDVDGSDRSVIVFDLVPQGSRSDEAAIPPPGVPLEELRRRALAASAPVVAPHTGNSVHSFRIRSRQVAEYVVARADEHCESCGSPAPFRRTDNTPYLETHHIRRVADDGADHPRWVAAVCPNCHRRAHHGSDRDELKRRLAERLASLEGTTSA
ncbi:MAG: HNH endonuclease [Actinobacteria bacterium]|nr:HNH endonuclease [Actinomycetota bacterium]